jgi:ATP-dependent protease HslVU (ClpYQ) peptidase subunit
MTTIVVVRKPGSAVIGADTLVTYGEQSESAELIRNHSKLIRVDDTWLAVTGHAALDLVLRRLFARPPGDEDAPLREFGSAGDIFATFVDLHERMKREFFLKTEEEKDEEFESMHMNVLVANAGGIFGVCSRRSVFEYARFYAYGSGDQYALGAMHAVYDRLDDPLAVARAGLEAAATFDIYTGAPFQFQTTRLAE